jgi:hypothetical protein
MGMAIINQRTMDLPFRVWNNLRNLKRGIAKATGIKLVMLHEPLPHHNEMSTRIRGQCVLSGKLGTSPSPEDFREFPIENTQYDELEPGQFNEYEMRIDLTNWPTNKEYLIEDLLSKVYIVIEADE